jgi:hypothetical protein
MSALFIVSLFVLSFSIAGNSAAIPTTTAGESSLLGVNPIDLPVTADEGTNLDWYTDTGSYNDTWTWSNNNWLFGPRSNYELFFNNGSQIDKMDFIPLNEEITWRINIPKSILRGASLQNVYVNGWYMSPDMNFSSSFNLDFFNSTPESWSAYSYGSNYTTGYELPPYVSMNQPGCSFTSDSSMLYVTFKITFLSGAPAGLYDTYIYFYDADGNNYDVRSRSATSDSTMGGMDRIVVGIPHSEAFANTYFGGYTLEKESLDGDQLYSVSRGTDFMMRFNITGNGDLDYAMLWTYFSGDVKIPVNRSGFHSEMVSHTGGWVYDPDIQTYSYNSSIQYSVPEGVWGDYIEYEYAMGSDWREFEYRYLMYNMTTDTNEVHTSTMSNEMQLMYIYNFTSASFETLYGFTYWSYPLDIRIFELNQTLSNAYTTNNIHNVEFIGHFTDAAPKGALIQFNDRVRSTEGWDYMISASDFGDALMTWQEYYDAKEVAVESPVTIAKLLKTDASPVYGYFFPADPGTPFEVQGRLQGGADLATDIDGALFSMKSYDSVWSEDSYSYTDMYYEILVGADQSVTFTTYNYTAMENRTYGLHWEWIDALVTDWHWEYNMTSGETEWIYGDYWTSDYVEVEGWYYEWFYFNQKTGEWVNQNDWYYYGIQSEVTKADVVFAEVTDITTYTDSGDLYYSFLVNLTDSVREISHWWDFSFANNTWVEDPSSAMGFHDVGVWRPGWVHTFDYFGEDVYVDVSSKIGVYNSSIPGASDWLAVDEGPYITMNGIDYPILVRDIMYPYSTQTEERILFNDQEGWYYELLNGTKIHIQEYRFAGIYNVTVPGYGSFLSTQTEYQFWYDGVDYWYSWWDINGNLHQGTDSINWQSNVNVELIESSDATPSGKYIRFGSSGIMYVQDYPRNDPRTGTEYVLAENGTRYDMVYDHYDGTYYMDIGGVNQRVSYVFESYNATYLGAGAFVADWWVLQEQWSTIDGNYEMPYPGADADWSGVYYTSIESYGKVPTTKTISVSDTTHFIGGNPNTGDWYEYDHFNHTGFWVVIDSTNYTLDGQKMWHANVNGTSFWQPPVVGGSFEYGHFDALAFIAEDTLTTQNTYYVEYVWNSTYGYESNYTVTLTNGTVFSCEPRRLFEVYLVDANGTLVYTLNRYPFEEFVSTTEYYYYVEDLNGVRHYVDSYGELPIIGIEFASSYDVRSANGSLSFQYIVNGTEYIGPFQWQVDAMMFTNGSLNGKYFFRWAEAGHDNAIYEVIYKGTAYNATSRRDYIFQIGSVEGQAYKYTLAPIESVTFKNFNEIVVGNPQWALWGVHSWSESETNNALDLDGDSSTTDDQYYVMSEYQSTNSWYSDYSRMWVSLMWDPNGTLYGDEMFTDSWMGVETNSWSYSWQETYYWFHADDLTPVGSAEWDTINSTIFNAEGMPRAGYWDIAHMARNVTWEDILAEALANGWDWMTQDEQTWTWLSFGVGQHYGVDAADGWASLDLRYEYSGLMIWEDANNNSIMEAFLTNPGDGELTHYFIPDSVGSVDFVTPGQSFGVPDDSGHLLVGLEDEVTWGVSFNDVNGTTFPFNTYAYWDWYGGVVTGSDLRTFDERPTKVTIDEISFLVHFQGFINTTEGATSNYATLKVDNTVGQWGVHTVGGIANLEGSSLALNYVADISTSEFRVEDTQVSQEETVVSDRFQIGDSSSRFAEMIIGGVTYEWAADPYTAYNVSSQTTPFSTFTSAYESESGQSATAWSFTSTQYYVSIGFPEWDGYHVYQDPIFVGYISNTGDPGEDPGEDPEPTIPFPTTTSSRPPTGPGGIPELSTEMFLMLGGLGLVVVVLGVMAKRRK